MNENTHNFKIEHNTALKLEKQKVEELINCLKQKNGKRKMKICFEYRTPSNFVLYFKLIYSSDFHVGRQYFITLLMIVLNFAF